MSYICKNACGYKTIIRSLRESSPDVHVLSEKTNQNLQKDFIGDREIWFKYLSSGGSTSSVYEQVLAAWFYGLLIMECL